MRAKASAQPAALPSAPLLIDVQPLRAASWVAADRVVVVQERLVGVAMVAFPAP
jgi:hypothetical protein